MLNAADLNGNFVALAAGQSPAQIWESLNMATVGTAADLRWMINTAPLAPLCCSVSPVGDSGSGHVAPPKPNGVTCTVQPAPPTPAATTPVAERTIAIGSILPLQVTVATRMSSATTTTTVVMIRKRLRRDLGLTTSYTAYCCCYH